MTQQGYTGPGQRLGSSSTAREGESQLTAVVDQTKEKAGELMDQARETTSQLVSQATDQTRPRLEQGKEQVVQTLSSTADALRRTGGELQGEQNASISRLAEGAAEQTERVAQFLGSRDLSEIVSEVERFGRKQPALFLGAAFAVGLAGARFLRTSSSAASNGSSQRSFGTAGAYPDPYIPSGPSPLLGSDGPGMADQVAVRTGQADPTSFGGA